MKTIDDLIDEYLQHELTWEQLIEKAKKIEGYTLRYIR